MNTVQQVIIITGSSDGIGAEMARQLARQHRGALGLVLAARNVTMLQAVAQQCESLGSQVLVVPTDVGIEAQCKELITATITRFGRIDGLINNAGKSAQALFEEVTDLAWYEDLMRINFWGSVWCTHHCTNTPKDILKPVSNIFSLLGTCLTT